MWAFRRSTRSDAIYSSSTPGVRAVSLATPFLLTTAFFVFAANGVWIASLVCTMLLTFLTYGSIAGLLLASLAAIPWTVAPVSYATLMILGSWLFPLITSFLPHDPNGTTALTQTRLFRGRILSILALEHLYHLEHHLYPQVPHHNWSELGRRLDPYFARAGLQPLRLFF